MRHRMPTSVATNNNNVNKEEAVDPIAAVSPVPSSAPSLPDASSMMAARDKSLISKAMDNVVKTVGSPEKEEDATSNASEDTFEVEGNILADGIVRFRLATPSPMPSFLNIHFICETASRLLFLSIHWVRSIPSFAMMR